MYINIAVHYVRPKQMTYAREAFQTIIREVVNSKDLDLEADPSVVRTRKSHLPRRSPQLYFFRFIKPGFISKKSSLVLLASKQRRLLSAKL